MFPVWKHEDCFPIIKDVILYLSERKKTWVRFDEIVDALLEDGTVFKFVTSIDNRKEEIKREVVANMVAWFSQKITEYENGTLLENYKQFDLIEEARTLFDRRKEEGRYAYKLRTAPDVIPEVKEERALRSGILREKQMEKGRRQEEFRKLVEELKKQKVAPEEYRERIMKWLQKADNTKNQEEQTSEK